MEVICLQSHMVIQKCGVETNIKLVGHLPGHLRVGDRLFIEQLVINTLSEYIRSVVNKSIQGQVFVILQLAIVKNPVVSGLSPGRTDFEIVEERDVITPETFIYNAPSRGNTGEETPGIIKHIRAVVTQYKLRQIFLIIAVIKPSKVTSACKLRS